MAMYLKWHFQSWVDCTQLELEFDYYPRRDSRTHNKYLDVQLSILGLVVVEI